MPNIFGALDVFRQGVTSMEIENALQLQSSEVDFLDEAAPGAVVDNKAAIYNNGALSANEIKLINSENASEHSLLGYTLLNKIKTQFPIPTTFYWSVNRAAIEGLFTRIPAGQFMADKGVTNNSNTMFPSPNFVEHDFQPTNCRVVSIVNAAILNSTSVKIMKQSLNIYNKELLYSGTASTGQAVFQTMLVTPDEYHQSNSTADTYLMHEDATFENDAVISAGNAIECQCKFQKTGSSGAFISVNKMYVALHGNYLITV